MKFVHSDIEYRIPPGNGGDGINSKELKARGDLLFNGRKHQ
jgi:hypothetical protein